MNYKRRHSVLTGGGAGENDGGIGMGWNGCVGVINRIRNTTAIKAVVCALTVAHNRAQINADERLSVSRYVTPP
jgi:hypothetical protein